MPGRILVRIVLVLFASSFAAAAGCGGASPNTGTTFVTDKQKEKEGGRYPGGPGPKK